MGKRGKRLGEIERGDEGASMERPAEDILALEISIEGQQRRDAIRRETLDRLEEIIPGIFSNSSSASSNNGRSLDIAALIELGIPKNSTISVANSIGFLKLDLNHMGVNNPGLATVRTLTSEDHFLQACNEAMWGELKGDDAHDYIKGRCEFLTKNK